MQNFSFVLNKVLSMQPVEEYSVENRSTQTRSTVTPDEEADEKWSGYVLSSTRSPRLKAIFDCFIRFSLATQVAPAYKLTSVFWVTFVIDSLEGDSHKNEVHSTKYEPDTSYFIDPNTEKDILSYMLSSRFMEGTHDMLGFLEKVATSIKEIDAKIGELLLSILAKEEVRVRLKIVEQFFSEKAGRDAIDVISTSSIQSPDRDQEKQRNLAWRFEMSTWFLIYNSVGLFDIKFPPVTERGKKEMSAEAVRCYFVLREFLAFSILGATTMYPAVEQQDLRRLSLLGFPPDSDPLMMKYGEFGHYILNMVRIREEAPWDETARISVMLGGIVSGSWHQVGWEDYLRNAAAVDNVEKAPRAYVGCAEWIVLTVHEDGRPASFTSLQINPERETDDTLSITIFGNFSVEEFLGEGLSVSQMLYLVNYLREKHGKTNVEIMYRTNETQLFHLVSKMNDKKRSIFYENYLIAAQEFNEFLLGMKPRLGDEVFERIVVLLEKIEMMTLLPEDERDKMGVIGMPNLFAFAFNPKVWNGGWSISAWLDYLSTVYMAKYKTLSDREKTPPEGSINRERFPDLDESWVGLINVLRLAFDENRRYSLASFNLDDFSSIFSLLPGLKDNIDELELFICLVSDELKAFFTVLREKFSTEEHTSQGDELYNFGVKYMMLINPDMSKGEVETYLECRFVRELGFMVDVFGPVQPDELNESHFQFGEEMLWRGIHKSVGQIRMGGGFVADFMRMTAKRLAEGRADQTRKLEIKEKARKLAEKEVDVIVGDASSNEKKDKNGGGAKPRGGRGRLRGGNGKGAVRGRGNGVRGGR